MDAEAMRRRFARLADALDEDERELRAEAAAQDPGVKIARGLELADAFLADYRRMLLDPAFAAEEDERAWRKADLHRVWRERNERA